MKKTFDCVEMKNQLQEQLWIDTGQTIEGLKKLLFDKKNNELYLELQKRKQNKKEVN